MELHFQGKKNKKLNSQIIQNTLKFNCLNFVRILQNSRQIKINKEIFGSKETNN